MTLPGDLTTVQATGTFLDAEGAPLRGQVTFTPNATLTDASGEVIIPQFTRTYALFNGTFLTDPMASTDNADISPQGWAYEICIELQAIPSWSFTAYLPHAGSPVDISSLQPVVATPYLPGYLPDTGGALSGTLVLDGTPPLRIATGAASGGVLTSDSSGNVTWTPGVFNVRGYGAKGNAVQVADGAMTASSATLTCSSSKPFTSASAGMTVVVQGAGAAGADLVTTISAYSSSSIVTLAVAASSSVGTPTGATVTFGTDDTAACQAAWTAAFASGGAAIYYPACSGYLTTAALTGSNVGNGMRICGDGNGSQIYGTGSYNIFQVTNGTGLTVCDLQFSHALTAPAAGASLAIQSVADYRVNNVSMGNSGSSFCGIQTTGGTSKTANITNSYIQGYVIGMTCTGSLTSIGSHIGGGAIGLILDSGSGHSVRLSRVGLYGPLSLTTRNSAMGQAPNKTVWFQAVEFNYQTGLGSGALQYMTGTEAPGGANLDNCGGDIHINQCWLAGSGLTIGGGVLVSSGRKDTGCTTAASSTTVLDAAVVSGDNGSTVFGPGVPLGTTISSVTPGTSFVMSAAATAASSSATLYIGGGRLDTSCTTTLSGTTVLDAAVISSDTGAAVFGTGIPAGATISSVNPGVSFVMSAAATLANAGGATVNVGGTSAPIQPTWVDIVGGDYSGNTGTLNNGIHLKGGRSVTITGAHLVGSASHLTYDDILIESAVQGPVTISGCEFSGSAFYNINCAGTSGPFTFAGNSYSGYSATVPVNYPSGSASQYTILGGGASTLLSSPVAGTQAITAGVAVLTDASTIAVNAALGNHFRVTLGGNRTLGLPTNPTDGQKITIAVTQDGTGSRTLAYNAVYVFSASLPQPTLTTAAGAVDMLAFVYSGSATVWRCVGFLGGFTA